MGGGARDALAVCIDGVTVLGEQLVMVKHHAVGHAGDGVAAGLVGELGLLDEEGAKRVFTRSLVEWGK